MEFEEFKKHIYKKKLPKLLPLGSYFMHELSIQKPEIERVYRNSVLDTSMLDKINSFILNMTKAIWDDY